MLEHASLEELFRLVRRAFLGRDDELGNRRHGERLSCPYQVVARVRGADYPCELIDISYDGLRLRCPVRMPKGLIVTVSSRPEFGIVGRQRLRCKVAWARTNSFGTEAGLKYSDTQENLAVSWVQMALKRLDPDQKVRKARRIPAGIFVDVLDKNAQSMGQGICVDLGTGGALLRMRRPPTLGDSLQLALGAGEHEANIRLPARVVSRREDRETGDFLVGVRFFPDENRDHQRLRSLLLTLLDEQPHCASAKG